MERDISSTEKSSNDTKGTKVSIVNAKEYNEQKQDKNHQTKKQQEKSGSESLIPISDSIPYTLIYTNIY